ncbi:sensor histidine kinase [Streptomyces sp. NBC_00669]|uniref:sensor histidine kinase n=1 Tax=Streptomyces sp. NBC_00669 TaxID=2976011 RepID=UPI002E37115D|nr:sensor domain-containing protein [Streptomyces sp. NBC_00669]
MTESFPAAVRGWWRPGGRYLLRTGRHALVESSYLLTAPVAAAAGLLLVLGGLGVRAAGALLPGGPRVPAWALAPVRWFADVERWRIAAVRPLPAGARRPGAGPEGAGRRKFRPEGATPRETVAGADPGLWLEVAHPVVVLPLALVTAAVTALWWFVGVSGATAALRYQYAPSGSRHMRPMSLYAGSDRSHVALSLGLASPAERAAFGTALGVLVLVTLPLVTRACVAAQTGLGRALLSGATAVRRRISGLEQERDTARAQTVAAVTAEASALRRLERDIHDGPQQRLVLLAMELGRAQRHLDSRPEAVRAALADAIVQTQEALEELRGLSRGIAPPILVDRGLREALTALAARSTVPVEIDAEPLERRLDAAVETAAYFVVAEALTNVAKHSRAGRCTVGLRYAAGVLRVRVTDDGAGGAALDKGHGLRGLDDRLHAVGGRLRISSPEGGPTTITAELPC